MGDWTTRRPARSGVSTTKPSASSRFTVSLHGSTGTTGSTLWLIPALLADSAGMGMAIGPLAAAAMDRVRPEHAGAASGVVGTVMQVGGAIGIAVIGIVFYGALGHGAGPAAYPHAFEAGLALLVVVEIVAAALLQLNKE